MNHDALSKALFALPRVEADLLRIVAAGWVHLLDLSKLERLSAEHPSANLTQRIGDLVWRAPFREGKLLDGNRPWLPALAARRRPRRGAGPSSARRLHGA